jgi:hypothetical protein
MRSAFTPLALATWCLLSTGLAAAQTQPPPLPRIEVVVLVDLSDRLQPNKNPLQRDRDTAIVRVITEEFAAVVRRNRYLFSRDRLRMVFVGGEAPPMEPRVDVEAMNASRRVVVRELPNELSRFRTEASAALFAPRRNYVGADFWSWFRYTGPRQLVGDPAHLQRRIIILTDGYLEFSQSVPRESGTAMRMDLLRGRRDWATIFPRYRLAPVGYKFANTKVLILELAPRRPEVNTSEQAILERYWSDWFGAMGAPTAIATNADALPAIRDVIHRFLQ